MLFNVFEIEGKEFDHFHTQNRTQIKSLIPFKEAAGNLTVVNIKAVLTNFLTKESDVGNAAFAIYTII